MNTRVDNILGRLSLNMRKRAYFCSEAFNLRGSLPQWVRVA